MNSLKDFEKDLNKCSKCGLCETVCPLFKIVPNDCVASKGKFIMLHGVTKGDLKLSKNINKYLDMCLKCAKCNQYCPSNIDVCAIVNTAKYEYNRRRFVAKIVKILQSKYVFSKIINLGKYLSKKNRPKRITKNGKTKVLYFKGCVNQIFPDTDKYIDRIIDKDIEIIEPNFECCGLPFLSEGNLERFIEVARHNCKNFNTEFDYIVTDCASCESTLMGYRKYLPDCKEIPAGKFVNWGDLIALYKKEFVYKNPLKVTFHKPCHLKNDAFFKRIINNCKNVSYVEMKDYDGCCGFAGSFALKNPNLSKKLVLEKGKNIINTNADYVITSCPSCILGLKRGIKLAGGRTKVVSLLEFLSMADDIK